MGRRCCRAPCRARLERRRARIGGGLPGVADGSRREVAGAQAAPGSHLGRRVPDGRARKAHVFPDVPRAFARWREASVTLAIYSSGSVLAQRLLFGATAQGDLTAFIAAFFDTGVGAKAMARQLSPDLRRVESSCSRTAVRRQIRRPSSMPRERRAVRCCWRNGRATRRSLTRKRKRSGRSIRLSKKSSRMCTGAIKQSAQKAIATCWLRDHSALLRPWAPRTLRPWAQEAPRKLWPPSTLDLWPPVIARAAPRPSSSAGRRSA